MCNMFKVWIRRLDGCVVLLMMAGSSGAFGQSAAQTSGSKPTPAATPAQPNLGDLLAGSAKADYEAARLLYLDGDFSSALVKFQSAYDISHEPRLLWNLAACHKQLRHYAQLEALLKRYLVEGASVISAADRAEANGLLETIGPFLADATIQVNETASNVYVNDQFIGQSPFTGPIRLDLGSRRLRVEKVGFVPYEEVLQVRGGSAIAIAVSLQPEVHQGTLRVFADGGGQIRVDGQVRGIGVWSGILPSGPHLVEVSANGKLPYHSDVVVMDNQTNSLRAMLENRPTSGSGFDTTWLWVAGSALLAAGLGVAGYYQFGPDQRAPAPVTGTLDPGKVSAGNYRR
jgi:hypothetical protein